MKLLIVFPSMERGGAEGYALTIARAAVSQGWQVDVASPPTEATRGLVDDFRAAGAVWHPLAIGRAATFFGRRPKPLVPFIEFVQSLRLLRRLRPDAALIVLPGVAACFPTQVAAAASGLPAVSCFQLTPRVEWKPSAVRSRLLSWARGRRQVWVSVSEHNASYVAAAFAIPQDSLRVIHNGAPLSSARLDVSASRKSVREELGLSAETKIVLTVARLGRQKAHEVLLDAIPLIVQKHPNTHFVWIGEGELRAELEEKISRLELRDHVHLLGFRTDVPRWLAASDIFAFPTHYEGLPFSVVEAMSAALPVVASCVSSIPEVLAGGTAGLLVEPNDAQSWARALGEVLDDPRRARSLAENARDRAQRYSESRMVADTLALLESLVDNGDVKS